jgi:hypothetical protein
LLHCCGDHLSDESRSGHQLTSLKIKPRNLLWWQVKGDGAALEALRLHGLR